MNNLVFSIIQYFPHPFWAAQPNCSPHTFFFLPTWYEYLPLKADAFGQCAANLSLADFPGNILPIGLAVLDILLRLAGFVAVVAIIMAGIGYITAQGNAEKAGAARKRLYNSLISLGIVFAATGIVAFIGNTLVAK